MHIHIPFPALQLFTYHARDNARFDRSFQHRSAILNTHNDVSDRIWETSESRKACHPAVARQFSRCWILEYSRDLRLHRSTESIHPRMVHRTNSSISPSCSRCIFIILENRIGEMTCRAVPLYLRENDKEITMSSYVSCLIFAQNGWISFPFFPIFSLFQYFFLFSFFFSFHICFSFDKKDNAREHRIKNERTSIHHATTNVTMRSHRNGETSMCIRCMLLYDFTGSLFVHGSYVSALNRAVFRIFVLPVTKI